MKVIFILFLLTSPIVSIGQRWIDAIQNFSTQENYDSVILYCSKQKLLENINAKKNDSDLVRALLLLGSAYLEKNNYDSSRLCFENTLTLINGNKKVNKLIFLIVYNNLGLVYYRWGYYNSSEEYYQRAIHLILENWDNLYEYYTTTATNLAKAFISDEKYEEAKTYLNKALEIERLKQKILNREVPSRVLHQIYEALGDLYSEEKNFVDAELNYSKSLEIAQELNNYELMAWSLSSLADICYTEGNYQSCEKYLLESLNISKRVADSLSIAFRLDDLSRMYSAMGNLIQADSANLQARLILKNTLNSRDYIISLWRGGFIKINLKKYEEGRELFTVANDLYKKEFPNKFSGLLTDIFEGIATCEYYLKNYEKAEKIFKLIFDYSATSGESRPITLNVYSNTLRKLSKHAERDTVLNLYAKDALFKISYMLPIKSQDEKIEMINSENYVFDLFFSNMIDSDRKDLFFNNIAYDIILKTKGYALHEEVNIRKMIKYEDADVQYLYTQLIKAKTNMAQTNFQNIRLKDTISSLENRLSRRVKPFQRILEHQNLSSREISGVLKDDEIALEFFNFRYLGDSSYTDKIIYFVMALKKGWDSPKIINLFEANELNALLLKANGIVDSTYYNSIYNYSVSGKNIYDLIWSPLHALLKGINKVYISPSGLLHKINFNAVPLNNDVLLGQQYQLHLVGTTGDIIKRKDQYLNKNTIRKAWLFGGIDYDKTSNIPVKTKSENNIDFSIVAKETTRGYNNSWPFLKSTLYESAGIDSLCKQNKIQTEFISGPFASETAFKNISGEPSSYILHLATHGYFFPDAKKKLQDNPLNAINNKQNVFRLADNPLLRSGLIFSGANKSWNNPNYYSDSTDDGILTAYEVSNLDLSGAKLVVMSACETGLGEIKGSEGVFGLQRSFKLAGAENIIMSLWKVPDVQTKELMKLFYENCFKGMTISDALKDAQFAMSKKYPPYYWAAFKLLE